MANPPVIVKEVLVAVAIMLGIKDHSYINLKKHILSDFQLISKLLNYDKDNCDMAIVRKASKHIKEKNLESA